MTPRSFSGSSGMFWGKSIGPDVDQRRAYSRGPGESVTRSDRRGRERWLGGSAPPLAGPHESDGARWPFPVGNRPISLPTVDLANEKPPDNS